MGVWGAKATLVREQVDPTVGRRLTQQAAGLPLPPAYLGEWNKSGLISVE